ncbi:PTS sugar transporter subunit IIB, partial [Enterococcus dongliensis]|uniref:PTS sugar transporter subunit IIB n=1 Tax=Enterococcus dongliensis TaxID=2559925 RepID=UPI0035DB2372
MIKMTRIDYRLLHGQVAFAWTKNLSANAILDLSQYLGHILVETAKTFSLFLNLQT